MGCMGTRGANEDQKWFCECCERKTLHRIGDKNLDVGDGVESSEWRRHSDGKRFYWRPRVCTECSTPNETAEISYQLLQELLRAAEALDRHKAFHAAVSTAISSLESEVDA